MASVDIVEIEPGGDLREFLGVVDSIYADDRVFVRPLDFDLKQRLGPKNPFFGHGEARLFTAHRAGRAVGRVSASIDRLHLEKFGDQTGFFGFIDTIDDREVASALLESACGFLRERGMRRVLGPLSLSINEELGVLIDGFDAPSMILMPQHRPHQGGLIEAAGFRKAKDFYAWRYTIGDLPVRARRGHDQTAELPEVKSRPLDSSNVLRDVRVVVDVFQDAWSDNWGAVPFTPAEVEKMAEDFKLLLVPELTTVVEIDGEPAAFSIALPNVNEAIADLHGKLFPFGFAKLIYRLKFGGVKSARLVLLGIRKKYRHVRKYAGLSAYMYVQMHEGAKKKGIEWGELGWTLEDNGPMNAGIRMMGGQICKRYRVYERPL
jgi:hypothetical protein